MSLFCWSPSVDVVPRSRRQEIKRASKTRKKNEDKERKDEGEKERMREREEKERDEGEKESTLHYLLSELLFLSSSCQLTLLFSSFSSYLPSAISSSEWRRNQFLTRIL